VSRCLQEAARRDRDRHFAKMDERLLWFDNDFTFMRKACKALFYDECGQGATLIVAQLAATAGREIKTRCRLRHRQPERLGAGGDQGTDFTQVVEACNNFRDRYRTFNNVDDFVAQVTVEAEQYALFRFA